MYPVNSLRLTEAEVLDMVWWLTEAEVLDMVWWLTDAVALDMVWWLGECGTVLRCGSGGASGDEVQGFHEASDGGIVASVFTFVFAEFACVAVERP